MNEVLKSISQRRSIRHYTDEAVTEEKLSAVLDAAILAPSARNRQLRHISVIKNRELLDEMAEIINHKLGDRDEEYHVFHHAPVLLVLSAADNAEYRLEDIGIMSENIALAACSVGLGTCILGLPQILFSQPDGKKYLKSMGVPEGYTPVLSVTLGVPCNPDISPKPREYDVVNYVD